MVKAGQRIKYEEIKQGVDEGEGSGEVDDEGFQVWTDCLSG